MECIDGGPQEEFVFRLIPTDNGKYNLYLNARKRYCMRLQSDSVSCDTPATDSNQEDKEFEKVNVDDKNVAFKCQNGKFMVRANGQSQIKCTGASVDDAEKFEMTVVGDSFKQEPEKPKEPEQKQPEPDKSTGNQPS
jgi:hypothetical protein